MTLRTTNAPRRTRVGALAIAAASACVAALLITPARVEAQTLRELSDLSLEQLSQVEITSVSKRPEPLSNAAAAVYVITSDDIHRSGATTLAEALRLAPNVRATSSPSRPRSRRFSTSM